MRRSMIQTYVTDSMKAVEFYQKPFDAGLVESHMNPDGTYLHSELNVHGQILAVSAGASLFKLFQNKYQPGHRMESVSGPHY